MDIASIGNGVLVAMAFAIAVYVAARLASLAYFTSKREFLKEFNNGIRKEEGII